MAELLDYLQRAVDFGASDLFIVAGAPVSIKIEGRLRPLEEARLAPMDSQALIAAIYEQVGRSMVPFKDKGDDDFSFAVPGLARFRVNAYRQRGSLAAVVRVVNFHIPDYKALHIPEAVMALADVKNGMVLVTGPAGSGRSTTQACIVDRINHTREAHIITLEDPLEYLHRNQKSIVSQREVVTDTADYLAALRACLRQAPDVIQLGELRDHDAIQTAMTAAETGRLLLATLHTKGAANTIDRIVDAFPPAQQGQVRFQLSTVLHTVVSQQLLPTVDGGIVPAFELLRLDGGVRNLIRDNKTHQIESAMAAGAERGMVTMDQSIVRLYRDGQITRETALQYAENREQMERRLG